jgi:hypothetical protein
LATYLNHVKKSRIFSRIFFNLVILIQKSLNWQKKYSKLSQQCENSLKKYGWCSSNSNNVKVNYLCCDVHQCWTCVISFTYQARYSNKSLGNFQGNTCLGTILLFEYHGGINNLSLVCCYVIIKRNYYRKPMPRAIINTNIVWKF